MKLQTIVFTIGMIIVAQQTQAQLATAVGACALTQGAPSVACVAEQNAERPCPEGYRAEGEYCVAEDTRKEFPILKRASCQAGSLQVDNRCMAIPESK